MSPDVAKIEECQEKFYNYRNRNLPLPPTHVSSDPDVMIALEHYFYARSMVAKGEYSRINMEAMTRTYQAAKGLGFDLRHNPNQPTSPPSAFQRDWGVRGALDGEADLARENLKRKAAGQPAVEPPVFKMPPNFVKKFGG